MLKGYVLSDGMFQEALAEKGTFEQRPKEAERVNTWQSRVKYVLDRGNSQCKGPGAAACVTCSRNLREAGVA